MLYLTISFLFSSRTSSSMKGNQCRLQIIRAGTQRYNFRNHWPAGDCACRSSHRRRKKRSTALRWILSAAFAVALFQPRDQVPGTTARREPQPLLLVGVFEKSNHHHHHLLAFKLRHIIMREIVHIQAGQCGNQIGAKFWEVRRS